MIVAFGPYRFDSGLRELLAGGQPVHLSPKAFDVLKLLLERRPNVVDKRAIYAAIWPDTFVGDATLNVAVAEIRRALGEDSRAPRFIRTVHRVGYAFAFEPVVEVERLAPPDRPAAAPRCWLSVNERAFQLNAGENIVGRDPQCTVWLDESGISRRHARIIVSGSSATLDDLNSKNGTFVGSRRVTARRELANGDLIRFGSTEARFRMWVEGQLPETVRIDRKRRN